MAQPRTPASSPSPDAAVPAGSAGAPGQPAPEVIGWEAAAAAARRLAPAGPRLSRREAGAVVESVRYQANAAVDHVHAITGLEAARNLHDSEVLVVDRAGWSRANAQTFAFLLNRLLAVGPGKRVQDMSGLDRRVTAAGAAVELGGLLAFLSGKVLGQYDPFAALGGHGAAGGRLLLVAPNIAMLERELNVEPEDFRLWVCLHEQTHRVQFAAAPWLRGHLLELITRLPEGLGGGGGELVQRLGEAARRALSARREQDGQDSPDGERPVPGNRMSLLLDEDSAAALSQLTAIMSLMEGHANVVMDAVDASIVPTVKTIRRRFDARPQRGLLDRAMRRALGLDLKMRQYRDGQEFVRTILRERGMDVVNRVWEGPEHLPSEREIHNPHRWIARVLDGAPEDSAPAEDAAASARAVGTGADGTDAEGAGSDAPGSEARGVDGTERR